MKASVALLRADIEDELEKLNKVYEDFLGLKDKLSLSKDDVSIYDKAALGYLLHSFYGGCENIFRSISRFFENDLNSGSWHRDLLKRMTLEIEGFRPRVISRELFLLLDDFRAFRHKFRYSYSFELDWEREKVVANKFEKAWDLLQKELSIFLKELESLRT